MWRELALKEGLANGGEVGAGSHSTRTSTITPAVFGNIFAKIFPTLYIEL